MTMFISWLFQRKSSAPETEEKVRRLRRKNTELAVLAKRLEERARKLQEANLKVVRRTDKKPRPLPPQTARPTCLSASNTLTHQDASLC